MPTLMLPTLMSRTTVLITIVFLITALSCGISLNDSNGTVFSLEIEVVDTDGYPVGGLQVSAWNDIETGQNPQVSSLVENTSSTAIRGDINCNGLANEIGDYFMFKDYLLQGESAFQDHVECSIGGGDIDADGTPLTLSDFAYLFSVIIGDAPPFPPRETIRGLFTFESGKLTVWNDFGLNVLLMKFEGQVSPNLLVSGYELAFLYDIDSNSTNILITPPLEFRIDSFNGAVLQSGGELIEISGATADGRFVLFIDVSNKPRLNAPYPNPAWTGFVVPSSFRASAAYTFTISNLEGEIQYQVIDSTPEPGFIDITWQPPRMTNTAYRIEMEARSNDTVYNLPPQYAAIVTLDSEDNLIGVTSARGMLSTTEAWRFPSLFNLPIFDETDVFGNALGNFSYSDSVTMVLKRPGTAESKSYKMLIQEGINQVNLVWPF